MALTGSTFARTIKERFFRPTNMRSGLMLLLAGITAARVAPTPGDPLNAILAKMQLQREKQYSNLCGYSVLRVYTLHNGHLSQDAVMKYRVTMNRSGKQFKLLSEQHVSFLVRHALTDIVDAEPKTQQEDRQSWINRSNYHLKLLGETLLDGHRCYVLQLSPRRDSRYLVRGKAWIDAEAYSIRRVEGELAKSVSFWVGHPTIEENYTNFDGFWMPAYNSSVAHVKLAGTTRVTIKFSDYQFQRCTE